MLVCKERLRRFLAEGSGGNWIRSKDSACVDISTGPWHVVCLHDEFNNIYEPNKAFMQIFCFSSEVSRLETTPTSLNSLKSFRNTDFCSHASTTRKLTMKSRFSDESLEKPMKAWEASKFTRNLIKLLRLIISLRLLPTRELLRN